jgi:colanic acid/amylovoran biosynthesis glycosyltransferase
MRLAVFTSKYPARVSTFFERDMRALIEAGIDIDVFPVYPLDSEMWHYSPGTLHDQVMPRERIHHLTLREAAKRFTPYPLNKFATYWRDVITTTTSASRYGIRPLSKTAYVLAKSWSWAKQSHHQYDHVLAYWGNYAATCAYAFHRLLDQPIPFSIWVHAGVDLYDTPIYLKQKLLYADNIVTCCAFNQKYLAEHYSDIYPKIQDKINVCYHGLNFGDFPYQPERQHPNRIVAVGRLAEEKGFSYLLHALSQLANRGRRIELDFVGDGGQAAKLKSLAADLQLADQVRFRGWLKTDGVRSAITEAAILVHPSNGLGDGLPNVIREAMALGTPVIASDIAGIHEALDNGKCGILVPPRDVNALANAIDGLLRNESLRRTFAEAARARAEAKFDMWSNGRILAQRLRSTKRRGQASEDAELLPHLSSSSEFNL